MSTAWPLVYRVVFGSGGSAVEVDRVSGGLGLSVAVEPARSPKERWDGAGARMLISGPGAAQVQVTVTGSGRTVPSLAGLSLTALPAVIYWSNGTSTSVTLTTAGIASRSSDLHRHESGWTLVGTGLVTAGADPLGR